MPKGILDGLKAREIYTVLLSCANTQHEHRCSLEREKRFLSNFFTPEIKMVMKLQVRLDQQVAIS